MTQRNLSSGSHTYPNSWNSLSGTTTTPRSPWRPPMAPDTSPCQPSPPPPQPLSTPPTQYPQVVLGSPPNPQPQLPFQSWPSAFHRLAASKRTANPNTQTVVIDTTMPPPPPPPVKRPRHSITEAEPEPSTPPSDSCPFCPAMWLSLETVRENHKQLERQEETHNLALSQETEEMFEGCTILLDLLPGHHVFSVLLEYIIKGEDETTVSYLQRYISMAATNLNEQNGMNNLFKT